MKKLVSLVALAAALTMGGMAKAASVDIILDQTSPGGAFSLVVNTAPGVSVSQIAILVTGSTSGNVFTVASNGGTNAINISVPDSSIAVNGEGGKVPQIQLNSPATVTPPPLNQALFTGNSVVLGSLVAGNPNAFNAANGDDEFGYTANDLDGNPLDYTLTTHHVPEPVSLVLISLGLAGMAIIRRQAA